MSRRKVAVRTYIDLDVDLAEISDEDLIAELQYRKKAPALTGEHPHLPLNEQSTIIERHWMDIRKRITHGHVPSEYEVAFWWYIHGKSL